MAQTVAIIGGVILTALVLLTTASIIGRELNFIPGLDEIKGTYELTEAGVAFAIFAFLPICQFYGGHATVDVFTSGLGLRTNQIIKAIWEVVLTAVVIFISLQLYQGMLRYLNNGETTLFLQFPVWWSYAASVIAAIVACLTGLYTSYARVSEAITGRPILAEV
jgi:TRAP-type C4-dicarboxylate transport system permease small subunit